MTDGEPVINKAAFDTLLAVQGEDSAVDALAHRRTTLPLRETLANHERALAQIARREVDITAERAQHEARLTQLANEVSEIVGRATRIDERLRGGGAASFRDEEAMATEMGNLDHLRRDLDDEQLVIMEAIEPLEAELASLADTHSAEQAEIEGAKRSLAVAEAEIDGEIAQLRERRNGLAASVPAALLADYERLRARLGGVGIARVVGGLCEGCHLTISATQFDHLRHAKEDEVIHCEQCGRILVL
jgi:uncharacterized protein